jgi:hypothetical protein
MDTQSTPKQLSSSIWRRLVVCVILLLMAIVLAQAGLQALYWVLADTQYGSGYSESAFKKVDMGMTEADVRNLIGDPFRSHIGYPGVTTAVVYWEYSRSPSDGHYFRRWIGIDREGRVVEIVSHFYWD